MAISGSLSVAGSSGILMLRLGQVATVALTVAGSKQFEGTVQVESSRDQANWKVERDINNALLQFSYASGSEAIGAITIISTSIKNLNANRKFYRVTAPVVTQDPVVYAATEDASASIETIVVDRQGRPMFGVRQDGGVIALAALYVPNGFRVASDDVLQADILISAADVVSTSSGKLGHANGYPLVAAPGADVGFEFVSAIAVFDFDTHAYGGGGNLTINVEGGGSALTGVVSNANSLAAAADKVAIFRPLAAAGEIVVANKGINLVAASAFTVSSSSAGVARLRVYYRLHTLGLA